MGEAKRNEDGGERRCEMSKHYRGYLWSEAVSPITHMKGVEGNEALIAREPVDTPSGVRYVPFLSANALRHRCIRDTGGLWLIESLGLKSQLSLMQLNFLIHGGNLTESTGREDTSRIAEMQELFPLLRLMGGSLPDQILKGSLLMWRGMLLCEENRNHLPTPDGYSIPEQALKPAEHFVGGYQYTRGDAGEMTDWHDGETEDDRKSNLMIFAGEQVIRGSVFVHGFDIPHGSELEYGCLMHSLGLWQEQGGTIGGMASKGHGRLTTHVLGDDDWQECSRAYVNHVETNAEKCREWLTKAFAKKAEKPAKGKGRKNSEEQFDG
jgi:hypothetical protein